MNLDHRGACGCEANTRRRRGHADPDAARVSCWKSARKRASSCPRPASTAAASFSCRATRRCAGASKSASSRSCSPKARRCSAGALCRRNNSMLGDTAQARASRSCGRCSSGATPTDRRTSWRSSASSTSSASAPTTRSAPRRSQAREYWYISSLSYKTLVYKGMLTDRAARPVFPGPAATRLMETALALVHSRFSTNTFPSWDRAHPYRYIAHNGEINTLRGNINWMHARQALFESELFGDDIKQDPADHQPERLGLGDVRQHARTARARGPLAAARDDDDDSRAVVEPREHGRREARVLPISLLPDGTVGRPGVDRVHRRHAASARCSIATACARRAIT